MLDLDDLIQPAGDRKSITGKWCGIRFMPNPGNGDQFNIGVAFKPNRGKFQATLMPSAATFRCLYGSNGVENFSFLIAILAEHIQRTGTLTRISPHVEFGPLRTIHGETAQDILESLYLNIVTLRIPEDQASVPNRTVSTQKLRHSILREMRRQHSDYANRFMHEQPVVVNIENRPLLLDLPLWQSEDLVSGRLYGSIVSATYADEVYRQHDLDRAFRNLDTAQRYIATSGRGSLFILRPAANDSSFPLRDIENDIDNVAWPLAKCGVNIEVEESIAAIQRKVGNFIRG